MIDDKIKRKSDTYPSISKYILSRVKISRCRVSECWLCLSKVRMMYMNNLVCLVIDILHFPHALWNLMTRSIVQTKWISYATVSDIDLWEHLPLFLLSIIWIFNMDDVKAIVHLHLACKLNKALQSHHIYFLLSPRHAKTAALHWLSTCHLQLRYIMNLTWRWRVSDHGKSRVFIIYLWTCIYLASLTFEACYHAFDVVQYVSMYKKKEICRTSVAPIMIHLEAPPIMLGCTMGWY